ncbi:alpha/beta fold hydrolase [Salininema proteolyticum]|uniref:Alpha/beta fold hydrolase n=1 Tax=Salininema proteolyticum TaxID=1607685 RepID=A0ABV8U626_9ACTN
MAQDSKKKSTTVQSNPAANMLFTVLDYTAPGLAADIMLRQWCKIPPNPRKRLRGPLPKGAKQLSFQFGSTELWGWEWDRTGGEGPLAFAFHGWGGCTGDTQRLAEVMVDNGYRVISFDSPSHGNSGPGRLGEKSSHGVEVIETWTALMEHYGIPDVALAHSFGCFSAVEALQEVGAPMEETGLILVAPWTGGPRAFYDTLSSYVSIGPRAIKRFMPKLDRVTESAISTIDLTAQEVPSPTLVLHDTWDRPNPVKYGQKLADAWPNAELVVSEGLGHRRILADPSAIAAVERFLKDFDNRRA